VNFDINAGGVLSVQSKERGDPKAEGITIKVSTQRSWKRRRTLDG